jgi:hypothetical protein
MRTVMRDRRASGGASAIEYALARRDASSHSMTQSIASAERFCPRT